MIPRQKRNPRGIESDLSKFFRLRGDLVPVTVEQVAAAEESLEGDKTELPDSLRNVPAIPKPKSTGRIFSARYWTNPSVLRLETHDPIEAITQKARKLVMDAIQEGWNGPPYDPAELVDLHRSRITLVPTEDVIDARTRSKGGRFQIEFNPLRPPARLRFSLAHELAHTLFPDCAEATRNRATHEQTAGDEWQLEMLCNIAAAEILMPVGSLPAPEKFIPTVDSLIHFRRVFQVSAEAILVRLLQRSPFRCFGFAAHRAPNSDRYAVDYIISSASVRDSLSFSSGFVLPKETRAAECTAIGYTAKGVESWVGLEDSQVEYVGIPPYPGHLFPRVLGIVKPNLLANASSQFRFLKGDAREPRGSGLKILCQIVNDKALTWGAGFARAVRGTWPNAQREFTKWVLTSKEFRLGSTNFIRLRDDLILASLVAQRGYGESDKPRIRYAALEQALSIVGEAAKQWSASVHMPRIGTGQAGGDWGIVYEILQHTLSARGVDTTIYDLANQPRPAKKQVGLFDPPADADQFV